MPADRTAPWFCSAQPGLRALVASVYGMNFHHMPELNWAYGYPFALTLMLMAAVLPYLFFKWMKWL